MTQPLEPDVMVRQVEALAGDLHDHTRPVDRDLRTILSSAEWGSVRAVYLTGDGDSHHAACTAELAFESLADVTCAPMSALHFLEYGASRMAAAGPGQTLVIVISSSGETPRAVEAAARAKERGALTVALTGTPSSTLTRVADRSVVVDLPGKERSPGIRTYQASLLALLLTSIRLGQARSRYGQVEAESLRAEIVGLADAVADTTHAIKERCHDLAVSIADAPTVVMLGSGPNHGTALFAAAKVIEASGIPAIAQELEQWWHIERFASPFDMPVFVIAPPGRSHWRAVQLAARAAGLGRRVVAVAHRDDTETTRDASAVLPVLGEVREEFSPFLYHLFAGYLGSYLAETLGRSLFQSRRG
ncbi:MAG: SIS domain-containing protein [Pseudonocardiaceae bacterium]